MFVDTSLLFVTQLLLAQMFSGCILGTIMYYGILRQKQSASTQGYLIGYGICIPLCLWVSFQLVEWLDIRSTVLRMALCSSPMTMSLRCLQTMHGNIPIASQESLWDYILSVSFILRPMYDKNGMTIPFAARSFLLGLEKYMSWMLLLSLLYPFLAPFDFYPFSPSVDPQDVLFTFDIPNLYNSYFQLGQCDAWYAARTTITASYIDRLRLNCDYPSLDELFAGLVFDGGCQLGGSTDWSTIQ